MITASVGPTLPAMNSPPRAISTNCTMPGGTLEKAMHMNTVVITAAVAGTSSRAVGSRELRRSETTLQRKTPSPPHSTMTPVQSPALSGATS